MDQVTRAVGQAEDGRGYGRLHDREPATGPTRPDQKDEHGQITIAALVPGFIIAYEESGTFREIVSGAFNDVKNVVMASLTG